MSKLARTISAALAAALVCPAAFGADLPSRKAAPLPPPPVFTWTGFYLGFNHGFGGGVFDADVSFPVIGVQTTNRANGFEAGVEAGYQMQLPNNVVLGLETDMQWSDIRFSHIATNYASNGIAGYSYSNIQNTIDWFGTTRGRLGYSLGRLLPFITGGVAYGETSASGQQVLGGAVFGGTASATRVGWAAGAGLDYALSDNLSARAEYIYVQLPSAGGGALALAAGAPPLPGSFSTGNVGVHLLRTGLNWRFDRFALPATGDMLGMLWAPSTVDWSGFYVGAVGGYGGDFFNANVNLASPAPLATYTQTRNRSAGFEFGGQAGYNLRLTDHVVIGVETDAQWSDVRASHQAAFTPVFARTDIGAGLDWFGTTRARLGWATGSTLAYVTGGVAYGDYAAHGQQISAGYFAGASSHTQVGWTIGGGAEYALSEHLSLKAEYLYMQFSGVNGLASGLLPNGAPVAGSYSAGTFGAHVARFGVNWRFVSAAPAPVVAKY